MVEVVPGLAVVTSPAGAVVIVYALLVLYLVVLEYMQRMSLDFLLKANA
ncbi:hypothetical protein ACWPKS_04060 [Coraliomargarita sp. W4R72]